MFESRIDQTSWSTLHAPFVFLHQSLWGFPGGSVVRNPPANAEDSGLLTRSGISPGEGNGNPLKYSCLGNPMDRGAWWPIVHGLKKVGHNSKYITVYRLDFTNPPLKCLLPCVIRLLLAQENPCLPCVMITVSKT